ncbi:MAG: histidine kinase [bacterium]
MMFSYRILAIVAFTMGIGSTEAGPVGGTVSLKAFSAEQLEKRLVTIDKTCDGLASFTLRGGVGSIGCQSKSSSTSASTEWMEVDLGEAQPIDEIVLVPVIWRDSKTGYGADGFPVEFSVLAGTAGCTNVVATFGAKDRLLPRIAPLIVPCPGMTASWVRIEATALSARAYDGRFVFYLSELMVFNGQENVALRKTVQVSRWRGSEGRAEPISRQALVDGFVPYLMDAAEGEQSQAFVSGIGVGAKPSLTIDLGTLQPLDRIHLHLVDVSDSVPNSMPGNYGFPRRLIVEGATLADFSDAVCLSDDFYKTMFDVGPIIMRRFFATRCRYVRLTAIDPYVETQGNKSGTLVGLAEIECFANGKNVAVGTSVSANFDSSLPDRKLSAITDGCNYYGKILSVRDWMEQLALRHDLEAERPVVAAELKSRYERQKFVLRWMSWLTVVLAAGIGLTVLVDRHIRQRQMNQLKQRFAADLHDELGANLHAIGIMSDLAKDALDSSDELKELVGEIRAITERTGAAVRYCSDMQESNLYGNMVDEMNRTARRIMADLDYSIAIEGAAILDKLRPRTRVDLFLFFKESLINISRHSKATKTRVSLVANRSEVSLTITDNGVGLADLGNHEVPLSLKRRARLLGAQVSLAPSAEGGACITLILRRGLFRAIG